MARIDIDFGLDLTRINLNWPISNQYRINFYNDRDLTLEGKTYRAGVEILSYGGGNYFATVFLGDTISYSASQGMTGGKVITIGEAYWTGSDWDTYMMITGVSMSARDLWRVAQTPSNSDDLALFQKALQGNDVFDLSNGDDRANAYGGDDTVLGRAGDDNLRGGEGDDLIRAGAGADWVAGGSGQDELWGNSGEDRFVFFAASESDRRPASADVIADFVSGEDRINLRPVDAFARTKANNDFVWVGREGFSLKTKGEVGFRKVDAPGTGKDHTLVLVDTDGDRDAEMVIRLTGLHDLKASDFIL
jgi:serralysin